MYVCSIMQKLSASFANRFGIKVSANSSESVFGKGISVRMTRLLNLSNLYSANEELYGGTILSFLQVNGRNMYVCMEMLNYFMLKRNAQNENTVGWMKVT